MKGKECLQGWGGAARQHPPWLLSAHCHAAEEAVSEADDRLRMENSLTLLGLSWEEPFLG